jgi:polyisoprenoid-binding protein YceI
MKAVLIILFALISLDSSAQQNGVRKIDIDVTRSKLEWTGKKLGGEHYGEIQLASGYLTFNKGKLAGGSFEIDMNGITCVDITDQKSNKRLVDHLKSEDFFSVTRFPVSRFVITRAEPTAAGQYLVTGNLTIKEITNPIAFTVTFNPPNNPAIAEATMVFDRSKFDVKFGSQSFFSNLGDRLVYDDVEMKAKLILRPE